MNPQEQRTGRNRAGKEFYMDRPILEIKNLKTYFYVDGKELRAVDGLSYSVNRGECVAVVGESASGKSVSALSVLRLVADPPGRIVSGEILLDGVDLLKLSEREIRKIRGNRIAMVFQEPGTALNPVLTIGRQLTEGLELHKGMKHKEALQEAVKLLGMVGIPNPEQRVKDYPYQFSGGMQQRIMIAMAMSCNPDVLIADEPTTALDVTVQAQLLEVLNNLRREYGTALIIITHNLGVVARYAEKVQVVYAGRLVEGGTAEDIFCRTCHPYTRGLIRAVPRLDMPQDAELVGIEGTPPNLAKLSPHLCAFSERCKFATEQCKAGRPELEEVGPGHVAACFHAREFLEEGS